MLKKTTTYWILIVLMSLLAACTQQGSQHDELRNMKINKTAAQILGDSNYQAISYGGYREKKREVQPTVEQLKEDMRILEAMGIKVLRTYNTQYKKAGNVLKAIREEESLAGIPVVFLSAISSVTGESYDPGRDRGLGRVVL